MPTTIKQNAIKLINSLPDSTTWDDIMYEICVKQKIDKGLNDTKNGKLIPHNNVKKISKPTEIKAHGNKPKLIQEFIGRVNSNTEDTSIAKMNSPEGWIEPGQTPEFNEYTIALRGKLSVKTKNETFDLSAGEAFIAPKGEWVQYSTPYPGGAEYIAVCIPAFSPNLVHRNEDKLSHKPVLRSLDEAGDAETQRDKEN